MELSARRKALFVNDVAAIWAPVRLWSQWLYVIEKRYLNDEFVERSSQWWCGYGTGQRVPSAT
jgi:hypothetical protein